MQHLCLRCSLQTQVLERAEAAAYRMVDEGDLLVIWAVPSQSLACAVLVLNLCRYASWRRDL